MLEFIYELPGASTHNVSPFIPPPGKFDLIVLLIGGNDLYDGYHPSETSSNVVALRIADLAEKVLNVTKKVFVIAVPPDSLLLTSRNFCKTTS